MRSNGFVKKMGLAAALTFMAGVAGALDYSPNAVNWNLAGNPAAVTVRAANQATGELYADVMRSSVAVQRQFRRALPSIYSYNQTAHMQNRADAAVASEDALANTAELTSSSYGACPTTMCSPGSNWVMWDVPWMQREAVDAADGYMGYKTSSSGFATGVSRLFGDAGAIGLAIGYDARKMIDEDDLSQRNNADTLHLALYGGTNIGYFFLDGYAGWSRSWNRAERLVDNSGTHNPGTAILKSNYRDDVFSAGIKASYVWILANEVRITPSVGIDFSHAKLKSFRERFHAGTTNADSRLSHNGSSYTNVALPVMVAVNKTFASNFLAFKGAPSLWTPEARAGWAPQFGSKNAATTLGSDFDRTGFLREQTTSSNPRASSYGTVGAGLKMKLADKYIFAVDYDYTFVSDYSNHSLTAMYGVSF